MRLTSIGAGVDVLYHQAFVVKEPKTILVFLGLWLCAVPPALWLDRLGRLTRAAQSIDEPMDKENKP